MKKILIIDDSTTNIILLEAILKIEGCAIFTATSAKDAYSMIEKSIPDIILLDLIMPRIDGFEFLETIKTNEKTKDIPVVVISAIVNEETIRRCMSMGALDFIKKPIDTLSLINKVKNIINL